MPSIFFFLRERRRDSGTCQCVWVNRHAHHSVCEDQKTTLESCWVSSLPLPLRGFQAGCSASAFPHWIISLALKKVFSSVLQITGVKFLENFVFSLETRSCCVSPPSPRLKGSFCLSPPPELDYNKQELISASRNLVSPHSVCHILCPAWQ